MNYLVSYLHVGIAPAFLQAWGIIYIKMDVCWAPLASQSQPPPATVPWVVTSRAKRSAS